MTAEEIIHEIESLPLAEQARVIRYAYQLDSERKLTGEELSRLAQRMVQSSDPAETAMLREEISKGFYGSR